VIGERGQPAKVGLARPALDGSTLAVPAITGPIHSHQAVTAVVAVAADGTARPRDGTGMDCIPAVIAGFDGAGGQRPARTAGSGAAGAPGRQRGSGRRILIA
jgi:hypothetical protein